jgi:hypothetical protein
MPHADLSHARAAVTAIAAERVLGHQRPPKLSLPPAYSAAAGDEAVELCASAGMMLDDWQAWSLRQGCGTLANGLWAAFEVGILCSRQNGKNEVILGREIAGLVHFHESLIIHTAHEFKASTEHFRKVRRVFEANDWLMRRVKPNGFRTTTGQEAIELRAEPALIFGPGARQVRASVEPRLRFLARSRGSGRSFTCDLLVFDEAMILSDDEVDAALPTLSAVPNPQVWYLASAGYPDSLQLSRVRNRGLAGTDPSLTWLEWSIDPHTEFCEPGCRKHDEAGDVASWAKANPGLGIRLSVAHTQREYDKMGAAGFARERLGVGDWPVEEMRWAVISEAAWDACAWKSPTEAPGEGQP